MKNNQLKGWLYLLPALLFLGAFMIYPLVDVVVYSFEEGYNSASQTFFGTGLYNYSYVLHDPYFLQAVKNTFILVIITVPISTGLGLLISLGLNSIKKLKELYQTVFFLPYVTNTLAVGLVFMILFKKTAYTDGMVNLLINLFGMIVWGIGFYTLDAFLHFSFTNQTVNPVLIAFWNSLVRIGGGVVLFPFIRAAEKLACILIPDSEEDLEDLQDNADFDLLDERLLSSPSIALEQCSRVIRGMSGKVRKNVGRSLNLIHEFSEKNFSKVQRKEELIDKYESKLGSYLVILTKSEMNSKQTRELTADLRVIGDLERIGDYASSIAYTTKQLYDDNISFSETAMHDLNALIEAERDIVNSTIRSFLDSDLETAMKIKPFSAAISSLCEILRARHIGRLRRGECTMGQGAGFNDLLNCFDRIASHCVAISGQVRRAYQSNPDYHVHSLKARELTEEEYQSIYNGFLEKYDVVRDVERPISIEDEAVK